MTCLLEGFINERDYANADLNNGTHALVNGLVSHPSIYIILGLLWKVVINFGNFFVKF